MSLIKKKSDTIDVNVKDLNPVGRLGAFIIEGTSKGLKKFSDAYDSATHQAFTKEDGKIVRKRVNYVKPSKKVKRKKIKL